MMIIRLKKAVKARILYYLFGGINSLVLSGLISSSWVSNHHYTTNYFRKKGSAQCVEKVQNMDT